MSKVNDERILELKKQIETKKKKLKKSSKFTPVTNCSIDFEGTRYNIHTLSKTTAIHLLVKIGAQLMAAIKHGVEEELIFSGYKAGEWIQDIEAKMIQLNRKNEEAKLKAMEIKLDSLLSDAKQTELELNDIENLLK